MFKEEHLRRLHHDLNVENWTVREVNNRDIPYPVSTGWANEGAENASWELDALKDAVKTKHKS